MSQPILRFDLPPGPGNPRNSEGDFIQLAGGRILFIYSHFTGDSSHDNAPGCLMSRLSTDGGRTWSARDQLVIPREGRMNVMSVSLLRLSDGSIALFYCRKNSTADCRPLMRISRDEAQSWSDPIECIIDETGYYVLNNSRAVQLKSGRLLLPVAQHGGPGEAGRPFVTRGRAMCYFSDDLGRSWQRSQTVLELHQDPLDTRGLREPAVIELINGRILMLCRTGLHCQYISHSEDAGRTWSAVLPAPIPSPDSPASIRRIPSTGDLLLIWNNNGADNLRTPLTLAHSKDEGQSWQNLKILEDNPDGWYCYTAIQFVGDDLLLGYCAGNRGAGEKGLARTRLTHLPIQWIYS
jgi:predicted neuraminidase